MKNSHFVRIKQLFMNKPYILLYPIAEKTNEEKDALIETFNTCKISEDSENSMLTTSLYAYALAKVNAINMDEASIKRNIKSSYKTKKIKKKNNETGEKEINKISVEKRGSKRIIERYQNLKEENKKDRGKYEDLVKAFEDGTLTKEHLPLCDVLLKENQYKKWLYTALMIAIIAIPILIFILAKAFHM